MYNYATVIYKIAINISMRILIQYYTWREHIAPWHSAAGPITATAHRGRAHRGKLTVTKAQFFALNTAAERGTSDETEATLHRTHSQRRWLEADDCMAMHFSDNSSPVGGDARTHHAASLTLALKCYVLPRCHSY